MCGVCLNLINKEINKKKVGIVRDSNPLQARTDFMQKVVLSIAPLSAYADEVVRLSTSPSPKTDFYIFSL